jgi:hypothetical protein
MLAGTRGREKVPFVFGDNGTSVPPRLLDLGDAGAYLGGISRDAVERLINRGELSVIRVPAGRNGDAVRRTLVDRLELDALVERWREKRT